MPLELPVWHDADGNTVACVEKIKVMRENLEELAQMAQDAFEDALLMGCKLGHGVLSVVPPSGRRG